LLLFSLSAMAQMRLPSIPSLPSGETTYEAGGTAPDQPEELDSVSRPANIQGEAKQGAEGVKESPYRINHKPDAKRVDNRIPDLKIQNKDPSNPLDQINQSRQGCEVLDFIPQMPQPGWKLPETVTLPHIGIENRLGFDNQLGSR
jgi:hypothetical protein